MERADEPVHADAVWVSAYAVDPFTVPTRDKVELLTDWSQRLLASDGVDHVQAGVAQVRENKFYADLAGTRTTQQRVRIAPSFTATAVDRAAGGFETMDSLAAARRPRLGVPHRRRLGLGRRARPRPRAARREDEGAAASARAPYDLVIDPTNLWLTIHESVGHATEYDRAIGYEAAYAGTSFATPDKLGTLRYGSRAHARHGRPDGAHGLATIGFDDDGVATTEWDLVRDGVLVGYQLDRTFAPRLGLEPLQRLRVRRLPAPRADPADGQRVAAARTPSATPRTDELIAGVERGIYVVGDKSWSIDMQRYNFQFTGAALLRDRERAARRSAARRRLPGHHHGLLGLARRRRRDVDVAAAAAR